MKIIGDRSKCVGHAQCFATSEELFELDDDGYTALTELDVPVELEELARLGVAACPERALRIED